MTELSEGSMKYFWFVWYYFVLMMGLNSWGKIRSISDRLDLSDKFI